jgi:GNAT superfamily N-acetyltransferase
MAILIRNLQMQDCPGLAELMNQLGHPASEHELTSRFQSLSSSDEDFLIVSEDGSNNISGFLHAKISKTIHYYPSVEVSALIVNESFRSQGIGKSLMNHAEQWAQKKDLKILWLRSNIKREDAHKFYSSIGYEVIGTSHFLQKTL